MAYQDLMNNVRRLLRESIHGRHVGGPHHRKVQAQAYADGYMRALVDAGMVEDAHLLDIVVAERLRDAEQGVAAALPLAVAG